MLHRTLKLAVALVFLVCTISRGEADGKAGAMWPQWRGPGMTGAAAPDADPPTEWAELSCFDVKSGNPLIDTQRIDALDNVYASPVFAAGRLYFVGRDGTTVVMQHGETLDELAVNELDDPIDASPAVVGKELFQRGRQHLYYIAQ